MIGFKVGFNVFESSQAQASAFSGHGPVQELIFLEVEDLSIRLVSVALLVALI